MMRRLSALLAVLLVATLVPRTLPGHAQEPEGPPLVVFIEDQRLRTASLLDPGPDGVTQLETIFQNLGAETAWLELEEPLPEEARVVVLVRPLTSLPVQYVARLWMHMLRGNHLLWAIDPIGLSTFRGEGNVRSNPDRARNGLPTLVSTVYGISLQDTFVAEPWFTVDSITDNTTTHIVSQAEDIATHPISEPLATYDVSVQLWGARTMTVEPIGIHSYAYPLLYTESAYGETDAGVFNGRAPLEFNIGDDSQGHLFTAAIAENTDNGSRVAVLGDSEMLENGFGLAITALGEPVHPGNMLLAERIAAWLMDQPVEDWTSPSAADYTLTVIDGNATDWADRQIVAEDDVNDALMPRYDISSVRAFQDDSYLYLLIELSEPPNPDVRVALDIENTFDGVADTQLTITDEAATFRTADQEDITTVPDVAFAVDDAIELRIPLRVAGRGPMIASVCLTDSRTPTSSAPLDCAVGTPVIVPTVNTETLSPISPDGPRVIVSTQQSGVNVRSAPSTDAQVLDVVPNSQAFVATGRNAAGDWIQVQTASYTGWLADFLVKPNIVIENLPLVEE